MGRKIKKYEAQKIEITIYNEEIKEIGEINSIFDKNIELINEIKKVIILNNTKRYLKSNFKFCVIFTFELTN